MCAGCAQGYPGKLDITVKYELMKHSPELRVTFTARTDKATPGKDCLHDCLLGKAYGYCKQAIECSSGQAGHWLLHFPSPFPAAGSVPQGASILCCCT
jgi:hypothetical protein